jgi:hypothetical protein
MEASVFSFFIRMLLASPVTYVGFIVAIVVPLVLRWKPNTFLWLLALLLNLPSLQFLYLASSHYGSWVDGNLDHRVDAPPMAIVDTLIIFFWGTGGAGVGLVLWLIAPKPILRSAIQGAGAVFSRSFWKARQPD